jgi:hypothetical protein
MLNKRFVIIFYINFYYFFLKVKEILLQQKMICLFGGDGFEKGISMEEFTCFLRNVLIEFNDNIYIIYITGFDFKETKESKLTYTIHCFNFSLKNRGMPQVEMEGIPLLSLLEHDATRFWTLFNSLKEKMYEREENDRLKRLLNSINYYIP